MSTIDTLAWRFVNRWLERYSQRHRGVSHCFMRHSTASGAQSLLLSDYDLCFFVNTRDFDELRNHTIRIRRDLKKARVLDSIVLPASGAAYRLCASHYAHRSLYPMKNWRCVYGESLALPEADYRPPPLDHSPEGFLCGYLVPVIRGKTRRHPFEGAFMRRKLERERSQYGGHPRRRPLTSFYEVVTDQIRTWDRFYGEINFSTPDTRVPVRPIRDSVCEAFVNRWASMGATSEAWTAVNSVWVYPAIHNHRAPHVAVNFQSSVSAADCDRSLCIVLRTFHGLEFQLRVGTERSMLGRLGGLSRVSLLEPWLARAFGHCLYGEPDVRDRIPEPSMREVREKLQEYFLYLSYRVFPGSLCPYALYRLCFTADHLLKRRELVLDSEHLADIYGRDFLPESGFEASDGKQRLLEAWKELHNLDLFGP
jgi:hypothetical protein